MDTCNELIIVTEDPTYLAREINYNHQQVVEHGKSMLAYAAEAGRYLISVKGMLQHGEFGGWVEKNCVFPYSTARRYMQVSKMLVDEQFDPEATIDSLLDTNASRRKSTIPTPTDLSQDDASHALKLQALVERGATEGERDVARRKLEAFAKGFGMGPKATGVSYRTAAKYLQAAALSEEKGAVAGTFSDSLEAFLDAHATPNKPKTPCPTPTDATGVADLSQDDASYALKLQALVERGATEAAALRAQLEAIQGRINQLRTDCMSMSREAKKYMQVSKRLSGEPFDPEAASGTCKVGRPPPRGERAALQNGR